MFVGRILWTEKQPFDGACQSRPERGGRLIAAKTYGKKREHGRDPGDFERKGLIPFCHRPELLVCCVQSWRAMDNVLYAIPGATAAVRGAGLAGMA